MEALLPRRAGGILRAPALAAALLLTACAAPLQVSVDAIADPGAGRAGTRYVLHNANPDTGDEDLVFREFAALFEKALAQKGLQRVADEASADLVIRLGYGVSGGRTGLRTYSWPVYDVVGGEVITVRETTVDASGKPVTTTRTIQLPARIQRVGTELEAAAYTQYRRFAVLEARRPGDRRPVWKVVVSSVGESDDLRRVMPALAAAAAPFVGGNTHGKRRLRLRLDDPRVKALTAPP